MYYLYFQNKEEKFMHPRFLIVGAGFSGTVLAHQLLEQMDAQIEIWDERPHIGGNCHTSRDEQTGIMFHHYGPHIFHTDRKEIWDYINRFTELKPYVHRVKAMHNGQAYTLPINLSTINQFFGKAFTPETARQKLDILADHQITEPANFEEQALAFIGEELYKAFFYGYTKKQWGCLPSELPASILKRIPVRFNYDDNYHSSPYTGIPFDGYSSIMQKMIDHPSIHLHLEKKFQPETDMEGFDHIFYTGPLDAFFNYRHGRLGYRTVTFETHYAMGDHQGLAQMNYCDESVPYTRIVEHKHFTPWEQHAQTVYVKEFSKETEGTDIPFYPKRLAADKQKLLLYRKEAEAQNTVSFLGRLATYRYTDMHQVIGEALQFTRNFTDAWKANGSLPVFSNTEAVT
jgi:UDP-galactopyranose mutase